MFARWGEHPLKNPSSQRYFLRLSEDVLLKKMQVIENGIMEGSFVHFMSSSKEVLASVSENIQKRK